MTAGRGVTQRDLAPEVGVAALTGRFRGRVRSAQAADGALVVVPAFPGPDRLVQPGRNP
jgi:hypothetical protein